MPVYFRKSSKMIHIGCHWRSICDIGTLKMKLEVTPGGLNPLLGDTLVVKTLKMEPLGSILEAKAINMEPSGVTLGVKMDTLWTIGGTSCQISMFL